MNLLHLKYAVEIANTLSISQAAKNLYMAQPNLSRAVKDLEERLGITIFDRTTKGITVTPKGEEFIQYARKILMQIDDIEHLFDDDSKNKQHFSISVPRASYICNAFTEFSRKIRRDNQIELFYKETNSSRAINNILRSDYNLGIIRYAQNYDKYFTEMMTEKGLAFETVTEFRYVLLMSKKSPLARLETIGFDDLTNLVEIAHADPYVPSLPLSAVRREELPDNIDKRIFVFERASQFELLSKNPDTFMWVSPSSDEFVKSFSLIQRDCPENTKIYKDVLVYRKDYKLSELDNMFMKELAASRHKEFHI